MTQLIAVVATAVIVNGERVVIQPGRPLPELSEHDAEALQKSHAAFDPNLSAEASAAVEAAALAAAANFQAERERVQADRASTQTVDATAGQGGTDGGQTGGADASIDGKGNTQPAGVEKATDQAKTGGTPRGSNKPR